MQPIKNLYDAKRQRNSKSQDYADRNRNMKNKTPNKSSIVDDTSPVKSSQKIRMSKHDQQLVH